MDAITRGQRAAQILDDEVFEHAMADARERLKHEWTLATAPTQREALWHQYHALDSVARELRILRDNATVARHQQERRD